MRKGRTEGWYWVKRESEEDWQPAYWGPSPYPPEWRWRMATYLELHRGRLYRVGPKIEAPK